MFGNRGQKAMACNGLNDDIVKYDTKELDECLSRFFAEIRESDGSDSEPDSLRVMLAQTKWQQNIHSKGPRICRMQTGPRGQELFAKKATDNDQMQQKHFSIVQDEEQLWKNRVPGNKIQSPSFILCGVCSRYILVFEVAKSTMKCLSKISAWTGTTKAQSK